MSLEEALQQTKAENAELKAQLAKALQRVAELEAQLAQNSRNSSKPPSADAFVRSPKKRSLRKASGKKPGGQSGHQGYTLAWNDHPDRVVQYLPDQCSGCATDLHSQSPSGWQRRQVVDLPQPLKLHTVEYQVALKTCPNCKQTSQAPFPGEVNHYLSYGPQLRALAVYLSQVQLLPYARTCEVLFELFGVQLSQGSLLNMVEECYHQLARPEEVIRQGLIEAEVAHNDETGLYVEGQRWWLHVMATPQLTYYAYHKRRGKPATDDIGLLPHFKGTSVHDSWASYWAYSQCSHALCNAHILRELTFVAEQLGQKWANRLIALLLALKDQVELAQAQGQPGLPTPQLKRGVARYRKLMAEALAANPPPAGGWPKNRWGRAKQTKAKNLIDRLVGWQRQVLAFCYDFKVPFDNNQAERDLRMVKVQQKVSGCFRSQAGASYFCRIRSYISTLRKQGHSAFQALFQAFEGRPVLPAGPSV